jgi:very-long-chain (3R)-3-hydroxyacyl-CoA dehydratase
MEILHSLVGFVKSPWSTTFLQGLLSLPLLFSSLITFVDFFLFLSCLVFSRVWTLWAVMNISPTVYQSTFFTLACTSWALVEVPRYLFYAVNLMGPVPYPLFWLRYSLFAILYPTGITGELGCMYMAVAHLIGGRVKSLNEIFALPRNNLILLVFIVLVILTYIPGKTMFLPFL